MDGSDDGEAGRDGRVASGAPQEHGQQTQPIDPRGMSRAEYIRRISDLREQQQQHMKNALATFQPEAHEQVQRMFGNDRPPWYSLSNQDFRMQILERQIALFSGRKGSPLNDTETLAVGENFTSLMNFRSGWSRLTFLATLFLTFRRPSRATFKFPFFQPRYNFRLSPIGASWPVQGGWHFLRFVAYSITFGLFVANPVDFTISSTMATYLRQDERMREVFAQRGEDQDAGQGLPQWNPRRLQGVPVGQGKPEEQDSWSEQDQSRMPNYEAENTTWREQETPQPQYRSSPEPPQKTTGWDTATDDAFDDASPVAQPAKPQGGRYANSGGSSWERIRQQSQSQPPQSSEWSRVRSRPTPPNYGNDNSDASPQYRAPRDGYSGYGGESGGSAAKDRAQREFDELLDRERQGEDGERTSWNRK